MGASQSNACGYIALRLLLTHSIEMAVRIQYRADQQQSLRRFPSAFPPVWVHDRLQSIAYYLSGLI